MWEAAQTSDEAKRSFKNGVLGETWIETGEAPDWQRLYERREPWRIGTVPSGGLFLTAGSNRLCVTIIREKTSFDIVTARFFIYQY